MKQQKIYLSKPLVLMQEGESGYVHMSYIHLVYDINTVKEHPVYWFIIEKNACYSDKQDDYFIAKVSRIKGAFIVAIESLVGTIEDIKDRFLLVAPNCVNKFLPGSYIDGQIVAFEYFTADSLTRKQKGTSKSKTPPLMDVLYAMLDSSQDAINNGDSSVDQLEFEQNLAVFHEKKDSWLVKKNINSLLDCVEQLQQEIEFIESFYENLEEQKKRKYDQVVYDLMVVFVEQIISRIMSILTEHPEKILTVSVPHQKMCLERIKVDEDFVLLAKMRDVDPSIAALL